MQNISTMNQEQAKQEVRRRMNEALEFAHQHDIDCFYAAEGDEGNVNTRISCRAKFLSSSICGVFREHPEVARDIMIKMSIDNLMKSQNENE